MRSDEMRVVLLSRADRIVTEQHLHSADVGALCEQLDGERVPTIPAPE
jgi:hypothetical protein